MAIIQRRMLEQPTDNAPARRRAARPFLLALLVVVWTVLVVVRSDHLGVDDVALALPTDFEYAKVQFNRGGDVDVYRAARAPGGEPGRALALVLTDPFGEQSARDSVWRTQRENSWGVVEDDCSADTYSRVVEHSGRSSVLVLLGKRSPHIVEIDGVRQTWKARTVFAFDAVRGWEAHAGTPEIEEIFRVLDEPKMFEIERRHRVWQLLQDFQEVGVLSAAD